MSIPRSRWISLTPRRSPTSLRPVWLEYGAFAHEGWRGRGEWRIPPDILDHYVNDGGVVIVDGMDASDVKSTPEWAGIWKLFRCSPYPDAGPNQWQVPYARDPESNAGHDMEVVCRPGRIWVSDWLKPTFDGVAQVVAVAPIALQPGDGLRCSTEGTSSSLENDFFIDERRQVVWVSVSRHGHGYFALLGATVTLDALVDEHPDNLRWAVNVATLLETEAARSVTLRRRPVASVEPLSMPLSTEEIRAAGESAHIEFKEVAFVNETIKQEIAQAVAALANSDAGSLLTPFVHRGRGSLPG